MSPILRKLMLILVVSFTSLVPHHPAVAADVYVDCLSSNAKTFHSINDALNTLDLVGPNTITVKGVCRENVVIASRDRLTITGADGQHATIEAKDPGITLFVLGSHNITLDHLIIQRGAPALYVTSSSTNMDVQNCIIQNSDSDGLIMEMHSAMTMENTTIQNNSGSGINMANESHLTMATYPNQLTMLTGNGGDGLTIDGSQVQINFGVVSITGNAGAGISMLGGRLQAYGGDGNTFALIDNNAYGGLVMSTGASATLWGEFHISNNGSTGIALSSASSLGLYSSNHRAAVTRVNGHSTVGLSLSSSSAAELYGPHVISNNGSANADPGSRGGISMEGASLIMDYGVSVSGNVGPGIRLAAKSDISLANGIVSNNSEEGVRQTNLSAGGFYNPLTFAGNGGNNLYCDKFSVAFGDAGSIPNSNCPNITESSGRHPGVRIPRMH